MSLPPLHKGRGGVREKVEITPSLARQVAELIADRTPMVEIIKIVNLSNPTIKKIAGSPEFTAEMKSIIRNRVANLANKMVEVLDKQLQEGSLEAVKLGFKVLGAVDPEVEKGNDSTINVILPGAVQPTKEVIQPSFEVVDEVQSEGN